MEGTRSIQPGDPRDAHERADVRVGPLLVAVLALALFCLLALAATRALFSALDRGASARGAGAAASAAARDVPPSPRLQPSPRADMAELRAREEEQATTYGWIDREQGIVRLPLERALEIVAERGLPARRKAPEQRTGGH